MARHAGHRDIELHDVGIIREQSARDRKQHHSKSRGTKGGSGSQCAQRRNIGPQRNQNAGGETDVKRHVQDGGYDAEQGRPLTQLGARGPDEAGSCMVQHMQSSEQHESNHGRHNHGVGSDNATHAAHDGEIGDDHCQQSPH
ncbi:hypothetical protein GCM10025857_00640 [Alicyclobacillus contaminans]|nr:hypothetical protein GCM10025857_00640 [Alicyclobacillus contaminans]